MTTPPAPQQPPLYLSTTFDVPGYRIARPLGLVWGTLVRSVGFAKGLTGGFKSLRAGEVTEYTDVVNTARGHAVERLTEHARSMGANAIVGVRFESSEVADGLAEILAYGTAVILEPLPTD
ncbi:uncharacterized protein YbjQ (UPF0145 family) [Branchiibius hedensis]|uniref:UPF0145 protein SAMN04489750_1972 n=1 Tax=Branchiibius hedensis TaxID=672460 RepID=A0A2Y8ZXP3_9MICO|nr:YbjQ family protein [Branchiibius hedensis]PWJ25834.1 uncharacterized protein YbjQ (UPF0145 family) [Branchiibius hedensis]SSA34647.1 Uncharacterized conserved protein YbjQ, UPF0145 family [Branchiibius hedensis]